MILIPFRFISTDIHLLRFGIPVINVLLGIIGTVMIFSLAVLFEKTPVSKQLAYLGRNSLILMFIGPLNLLPLTHSFLAAYLNFCAIPVRIISSAVYAAELFLITVFQGKPILSLINRIDRKLSLLKPHADKQ